MPFWLFWIILVVVLFFVPLAWGYPRWGTPRPYYWRREPKPPPRGDLDATRLGWGWWADVLWFIAIVLVLWFVFATIL